MNKMHQKRGRPKIPFPVHPNRVLAQAIKTGLSTSVYIQGSMENSITCHHYQKSKKVWTKATLAYNKSVKNGKPDFKHITKSENNIRKNGLRMFFENAAAYGNTEVSRAKNPADTIGPMNQRLNIGGSALREFVMVRYPFPQLKPLADEAGESEWGYRENSLRTSVKPIHVTLPEMDFIDSCRTHIQMLDTHCYIHDVPNDDTRRYNNLFLLRIRPYLDYIYTEHVYGKGGFRRNTLQELKRIKDEIATFFNLRTGDTPTVTSHFEMKQPNFSLDFFEKQINDAKSAGMFPEAVQELQRIFKGGLTTEVVVKSYGKEKPAPCLTEKDVEYIWKTALERTRRKGSYVHQHITSQFPGFWNINRAIRNEKQIDNYDGYVLCSETPLETELGKGKADLILLRREATPNGLRVLHTPVFVLDMKTKLGFSWELGHEKKKTKSKERQRIVSDFKLRERVLEESEWKCIMESTPDKAVKTQVTTYAKAIHQSYNSLVDDDVPLPITGTLLIDATTNIKAVRPLIRDFIIKVFESISSKNGYIQRTVYEPILDENNLRMAIVIHSQSAEYQSKKSVFPPTWKPVYNPLEGASYRKGRFILYLSGASPTSGGKSAAWISKFFHGLKFLYNLSQEKPESKVIWLDLVDDFTKPRLAEVRLYLRPRSPSEEDLYSNQPEHIRGFFESFSVYGLFDEIEKYVFDNEDSFSLSHYLDKIGNSQKIIIVSGWDDVQNAVPKQYRDKLSKLQSQLIDQLPNDDHTTIVWFDSPVPDELGCSVYSTRALLPFYDTSPLYGEVNEIVWNLPVAPQSEIIPDDWILPNISAAPCYDDIRVIVSQTLKGYGMELTLIPPLTGWSSKFRSRKFGRKQENFFDNIPQTVPDKALRDRMKILTLTLIPWMVELWPTTAIEIEGEKQCISSVLEDIAKRMIDSNSKLRIASRVLIGDIKDEPRILERMKYRPKGGGEAKSIITLTIGKINTHRLYRSPTKLKTQRKVVLEQEKDHLKVEETLWYGQIIRYPDDEVPNDWIVIEDPYTPGRMLVGHFLAGRGIGSTGFQWSQRGTGETFTKVPQDISTHNRGHLRFKITGDKLYCWIKEIDDDAWQYEGQASIVSGKGGSVAMLRALKLEPSVSDEPEPPVEKEPPLHFSARVTRAIQKIVHLQKLAKPTHIKLVPDGDQWIVHFIGTKNEKNITELRVDATADLVEILTFPLRTGRPIRLDSTSIVDWSAFSDIDYGSLEALRPFIETGAPKTSGKPIPAKLCDIVTQEQEETLEVVLFHDIDSCPIALRSGMKHDACWRLRPKDTKGLWIDRLFSQSLTSKQIYGLLSSGQSFEKEMKITINLSYYPKRDNPEFCVFNEDPWIRRLLRENGIELRTSPAGAFLRVKEQKWNVGLETDGNRMIWYARSDTTGLLFGNRTYDFDLDPTSDFKTAKAEFLGKITEIIPFKKILNFKSLQDRITHILRTYGFGESGPECHLEPSISGRTLKITLRQVGGGKSIKLQEESIRLDVIGSRYGLLDGLANREYGEFNITNHDEFIQRVGFLIEGLGLYDDPPEESFEEEKLVENSDEKEDHDMDYESELLEVIEEYRKGVDATPQARANLGHLLTQLRFEEENHNKALEVIDESIRVLSISKDDDFGVKRRHAEALIKKCEILLSIMNREDCREMIRQLLIQAYKILVDISPTEMVSDLDEESYERIMKIAKLLDFELI
jgi:hypothetical protein